MIVRQQRWIARGLIAAFFMLYSASLALPCMALYAVADSQTMSSEGAVAAELQRGAYCWRLGGERLQLPSSHAVATAHGTSLSNLPAKEIACTSKTQRLGWEILCEGWLGPLIGILAWYANVFAVVSLILGMLGRTPKTAVAFALGSVMLGLDSFRFTVEPSMGMTPGSFLDHFERGFYVWEFSLMTLLLSQLVAAPLCKARTKHESAMV